LAVCPESIKPVLWYSEVQEPPSVVPFAKPEPTKAEPVHVAPVELIPTFKEEAPVVAVKQQTTVETESPSTKE